ncbi:MAG: MOSC domain-containing protein [Planctomycetota bacterium]
MPSLVSIQIGTPQRYEPVEGELSKKGWTTAFFKSPIARPVAVGRLGIEGDEVAEKRVHGGPDKAVCVYSADRFPHWREDLGEPELGGAAFGENFTVAGLNEETVCLGDIWRIGTAEFEVSQPRQPCWKLARRWKTKDLTLRVQQTGYTGWYLRVREEGLVSPGDEIERVDQPLPDWTIARANSVMYDMADDHDATTELAAVGPLADSWKRQLLKRIA